MEFVMGYQHLGDIPFGIFNCSKSLPKHKCRYCAFLTDLQVTLKNHICNSHKDFENNNKTADSSIKVYSCKKCATTSYSILVWCRHELNCTFVRHFSAETNDCICCYIYSKGMFYCKSCDYKSRYRYIVQKHFVRRHTDLKNRAKCKCNQCSVKAGKWLKCDQCSYKTNVKNYLSTHIKLKHPPAQHECNQCPYKTAYKSHLKSHILHQHTDPEEVKWFECDQCEFKARLKGNLTQHVRTKHVLKENQVQHGCTQCPFKTLKKAGLKRHIMLRHADSGETKLYKCDQCEYKAKVNYYLNQHVKHKHIPKNEAPYKCDHCSYRSVSKGNLRKHMNSRHTVSEGVNWFKCDLCDYKAKQKSNLKRHIALKHPA